MKSRIKQQVQTQDIKRPWLGEEDRGGGGGGGGGTNKLETNAKLDNAGSSLSKDQRLRN